MICALVRAGKRVGIAANSHKVIRNLLDEVVEAAGEEGLLIRCVQKVDEKHQEDDLDRLKFVKKNEQALDALRTNCSVGGGTSYFWARPDARLGVDVLFIDEAAPRRWLSRTCWPSHKLRRALFCWETRGN